MGEGRRGNEEQQSSLFQKEDVVFADGVEAIRRETRRNPEHDLEGH